MDVLPERLAIVGAGLVGGSIAAAALGAGIRDVRITDVDATVRERARTRPWGHAVHDELGRAVRDAQIVIAAVPSGVVGEVLLQVAPLVDATAILTDAASLKGDLTLDVASRLRLDPDLRSRVGRFVGGHPMAGSEHSGPEAADPHLFDGATWVLTPTVDTDDDVLPTLSVLLRALGARVVALSPARHDELVAIVSHLPQVAASALADVAADALDETGDAVLSVAGGGFRDTTRIAASDPALWEPILRGNRDAVLGALTAYASRLERLRHAVATDDWADVTAVLTRGSAARRRLATKEVVDEVVDVVVPITDRPGQLALAMTALGEAAVNVEDLAMRHAAQGPRRGVLLVRVAAHAAPRAVAVLQERGFPAHLGAEDEA